jgi:superfamily II DNA or RNA helicase
MKKCIIEVNDQVNCKLHNLELSTKRKLTKMFSYEVPGARYQPAVKLGRWDGKVSFFSSAGSTYINLLPDILQVLDDEMYDVELLDTRTYRTAFEFTPITEGLFAHKTWPADHQLGGQPIMLRDYQVEIVNKFIGDLGSMVEASTGAGKTLLSAALSYVVEPYGRSIVIVPNENLVMQTEEDYRNIGLDVGVYYGKRKEYDKTHTICTWQSLNALLKKSEAGDADIPIHEFIEGVVCVMVDEVHGLAADKLKQLMTSTFAKVPIRWGFTGTIPKEKINYTSLHVCLGEVIHKLPAKQLQDEGVLSTCNINVLQFQDHAEFSNYQTELKYLVGNRDRMTAVAMEVLKIAKSGNTIVLVDRIEAGILIQSAIEEANKTLSNKYDVVFVSGEMKGTDRKEEYKDAAIMDNKIIVATYGVAAVGLNIVRLNNVVLLEPGKSFTRAIQSIGRGLRKGFDKDHVEIYDITSTCKFSKRHLTERKKYYKEAEYPFKITKVDWK